MTDETAYSPPKVWTWNKENGVQFASINRPVAGPTHDKDLPVGRHPLQLYSLATPNGVKVTVMLEELLALGHGGAEYDAWLISIREGDQFGCGFVAVNPNSKIPALMDRSGPSRSACSSPARSCSTSPRSSAPSCRPSRPRGRMPVVAVLADGQRHLSGRRLRPLLRLCADEDRIRHRPLRHGGEAPARRARPAPGRERYLAGDDYTIADMAVWPWYGAWSRACFTERASSCRSTTTRTCGAGPTHRRASGGERGRMVNRIPGDPASQLHERHDASDFDTKTQDKVAAAS